LQADYKSIERVVIAGWSVNPIARPALDKPVKVILIPEFFDMIIKRIHESDFSTSAISENFPILRTIQMIDKYQDLSQKNQKK